MVVTEEASGEPSKAAAPRPHQSTFGKVWHAMGGVDLALNKILIVLFVIAGVVVIVKGPELWAFGLGMIVFSLALLFRRDTLVSRLLGVACILLAITIVMLYLNVYGRSVLAALLLAGFGVILLIPSETLTRFFGSRRRR